MQVAGSRLYLHYRNNYVMHVLLRSLSARARARCTKMHSECKYTEREARALWKNNTRTVTIGEQLRRWMESKLATYNTRAVPLRRGTRRVVFTRRVLARAPSVAAHATRAKIREHTLFGRDKNRFPRPSLDAHSREYSRAPCRRRRRRAEETCPIWLIAAGPRIDCTLECRGCRKCG